MLNYPNLSSCKHKCFLLTIQTAETNYVDTDGVCFDRLLHSQPSPQAFYNPGPLPFAATVFAVYTLKLLTSLVCVVNYATVPLVKHIVQLHVEFRAL
jgi:hypothetical protein